MQNHGIILVKEGSLIYNAADKKEFARGDMGKGKPKAQRIYSVYFVDRETNLASYKAQDAWGGLHSGVVPIHTIEPFGPEKR